MALGPPRDLEPRYDVKGGSPRTPSGGVPVREYQEYAVSNGNGNSVWKAIATGLGGLVVGLLVAWFSAFQKQGVTPDQLQSYVEKYYAQRQESTAQHLSALDTQLGVLQGKQEKEWDRITKNENEIDKCNLSMQALTTEVKTKMGTVADYLEKVKK